MAILKLLGQPNIEKLKAKNDIQGLIKALSYKTDSNIRLAAATALRDVKDNRKIAPLAKALSDKNRNVRLKSAGALEQAGWKPKNSSDQIALSFATCRWDELEKSGKASVTTLVAALSDETIDIRNNAAATLAAIGAPAVEALTAALENQARIHGDRIGAAYPFVPSCGVYAYGALTFEPGSEKGQGELTTASNTIIVNYVKGEKSLLNHPNKKVVQAAQRGEVLSLLPKTAYQDDIRWTIVDILKNIGESAAEHLVHRLETIEAIDEAAGSFSWALTEIGEPAVPALLPSLIRNAGKKNKFSFNTVIMATLAVILRKPGAKSLSVYIQKLGKFSVDANLLLLLAGLSGQKLRLMSD